MNERLTKEEIEVIRMRVRNASKSPWMYAVSKSGEPVVIQYETSLRVTEEIPFKADAEFIAKARTDIPNLLDEVERLRNVLLFYADADNYRLSPEDVGNYKPSVMVDFGKKAREALSDGNGNT